ncbi:hypothetical protein [Chryseobacterium sp. Leaf201]|uniref:hypothetical protein n=1 Tax=Chryseobacterium sp. Leaf201 TaxID=1735672 RepID=UPI000FF8A604|nr:hypothetical protein [Chryseobacterium sp. Leaf201]
MKKKYIKAMERFCSCQISMSLIWIVWLFLSFSAPDYFHAGENTKMIIGTGSIFYTGLAVTAFIPSIVSRLPYVSFIPISISELPLNRPHPPGAIPVQDNEY